MRGFPPPQRKNHVLCLSHALHQQPPESIGLLETYGVDHELKKEQVGPTDPPIFRVLYWAGKNMGRPRQGGRSLRNASSPPQKKNYSQLANYYRQFVPTFLS